MIKKSIKIAYILMLFYLGLDLEAANELLGEVLAHLSGKNLASSSLWAEGGDNIGLREVLSGV